MTRNNEIRRLVNDLDIEYSGDICELYAHVCNHSMRPNLNYRLIALKREIEHRIILLYMEEYLWEQEDTDRWRKIEDDEFWTRFRAAMNRSKKGLRKL